MTRTTTDAVEYLEWRYLRADAGMRRLVWIEGIRARLAVWLFRIFGVDWL